MLKQKLSIDEQIEHMKNQKGILFNIINEEDAKMFLLKHNYYFKIKAYAKNYDQYNSGVNKGKYINLEFAYLQELSTLDMHFRKIILKMTIDIEHFLKTQMMSDFAFNDKEDGYVIIEKLFIQYPKIKENIERMKNSSLCCDLIAKYSDEFAIWNIIEVISFGDFINLYKLYYEQYPSKDSMSNYLWSARILRNAAAHNNCLLNSLKKPYTRRISRDWEISKYVSQIPGISKDSRTKKMSNPVIYDFIVTVHLFNKIITSEKIKMYTMNELKELLGNRFVKHKEYFSKNEVIKSNFDFLKKIVDFYSKERVQ